MINRCFPLAVNQNRNRGERLMNFREKSRRKLQTFLEYPPMQRGASFNLDAVKAEMATRMAQAEAAAKGPSN
jgi:hypothetical protein